MTFWRCYGILKTVKEELLKQEGLQMKSFVIKCVLAIVLIVHCQYVVYDRVYCDYSLNGDEYQGVYWEDMVDNFTSACAQE